MYEVIVIMYIYIMVVHISAEMFYSCDKYSYMLFQNINNRCISGIYCKVCNNIIINWYFFGNILIKYVLGNIHIRQTAFGKNFNERKRNHNNTKKMYKKYLDCNNLTLLKYEYFVYLYDLNHCFYIFHYTAWVMGNGNRWWRQYVYLPVCMFE